MKVRKFVFLVTFFSVMSISQVAVAIDGYKNLKFGMSEKEIIASNVCNLQKSESGQPRVAYYSCDDFIFGGEAVEAGAFFIDNKFLRFVIVPSVDIALGLVNGLLKKYGQPSSFSSQKEFQAIDTLPNREAFMAFDDNTVFLKLMSDESYAQSAFLMYTSKDYDTLLLRNQQKSINDDL